VNKNLIRQLFPLPEGTKLRKPRFGKAGPSAPCVLPSRAQQAHGSAAPPPPFALAWKDDDLGVDVACVIENGELVACALYRGAGRPGLAVSVFLKGNLEGRTVRKTIPLDSEDQEGRKGSVSFGTVEQIAHDLGNELFLDDAFLLIPE
jgi:hypothetical protein